MGRRKGNGMHINNIIHNFRQSPWAILLPSIFIIQLFLEFVFHTVTFIGIIFGVLFWLVGCLFLIIISIYLVFYNKWATLATVFLLSFPAIMYYAVAVAVSKIPFMPRGCLF